MPFLIAWETGKRLLRVFIFQLFVWFGLALFIPSMALEHKSEKQFGDKELVTEFKTADVSWDLEKERFHYETNLTLGDCDQKADCESIPVVIRGRRIDEGTQLVEITDSNSGALLGRKEIPAPGWGAVEFHFVDIDKANDSREILDLDDQATACFWGEVRKENLLPEALKLLFRKMNL